MIQFWKDATGRLGGISLHFGSVEGYIKVHKKIFGYAPDMVFNAEENRWEDPDGVVLLVPSELKFEEPDDAP